MPYMALGHGLSDEPWSEGWAEALKKLPPDACCVIPAISSDMSTFLSRPVGSGEASLWIHELLVSEGFTEADCSGITSHSLKATLLTWSAMSGRVNMEDRRLIGHHVDKNAASPLNYSRDEATRLCALIFGVLELIRLGELVPDQARVARLADLIGQSEPQGAEAEAVSSDESSNDIDDEDTEAIAAVEHSLF